MHGGTKQADRDRTDHQKKKGAARKSSSADGVRSFRYKLKSFRDIIKVDSIHLESRFDSTQLLCAQLFRGPTGAKIAIPVSQ